MIDGPTYRLSEALARRQISTWELAQIHYVPFETQAFPQEICSNQELPQIMNIMQENRFDAYVREWDGLSEADIELLVSAISDYYFMCREHFANQRVKLPLSTMIAYFSIYKKLRGYNQNFKRILEVGPGSGNLAFFLKRHAPLERYASIEACEGYYLLQSLVNQHNFGAQFSERAFPQEQDHAHNTFTRCSEIEEPVYADIEITPKSVHYPWWRIGELAEEENYFDIVTSNANLMEMTHRALADYLALHKRILKDDGILFCQCLGGPLYKSVDELLDFMKTQGYGALVLTSETKDKDFKINGHIQNKYTCTRNGVFVTEKHPLYELAAKQMNSMDSSFAEGDEAVLNMFFDNTTSRRTITSQEIERRVIKRINETVNNQGNKNSEQANENPVHIASPENKQVNTQASTQWDSSHTKIKNRLWERLPIIIENIANHGCKRIAFYGNGNHTKLLFEQWNELQGPPISGIVVTKVTNSSVLKDIPLLSVEEAQKANFDAVILSSDIYELEMYKACRKVLSDIPIFFIHDVSQNKFLLNHALHSSFLSEACFRIIDGGSIDMITGQGDNLWPSIPKQNLEIFAFEPVKHECDRLTKKADELDYNVKTSPIGLWNQDSNETLYTNQDRVASSLFEPDLNQCKDFYNNAGPLDQQMALKETYSIQTRSLDSIKADGTFTDIDFIKLDVEGAEKRILEGAEKVLEHVLGLEICMGFHPMRMGAPLFADIDPLLRDLGFELVDVLKLNRYGIKSSGVKYPSLPALINAHKGNAENYTQQALSGNFLYFRKIQRRTFEQEVYLRQTKLLKLACFQEMYGHLDAALSTLQSLKRELENEPRTTVETIITSVENQCIQLGLEKRAKSLG